jgi:hypothetical protein
MAMLTKSNLNKRIKKALLLYPNINKYLGSCLMKAIKKNNELIFLLENTLIRSLYLDSSNLNDLEEYIDKLSKTVNIEIAIKSFKNSLLNGYNSLFFELHSAYLLKEENKKNIGFIPPSNERKTPDLEYVDSDGGKCFVEVKSLQSVSPEISIIDNKLRARAIADSFFKKTFLIEPMIDYISLKNACKIKERLEDSFDNLLDEMKRQYDLKKKNNKEQIFKTDGVSYKYEIFENDLGECHPILHGGGDWNNLTQRPIFKLTSVYSRIFSRFHEAYEQLLCYRNQNFNLVKRDSIIIYTGLEVSFRESSIEEIEEVIKAAKLNDFVKVIIR